MSNFENISNLFELVEKASEAYGDKIYVKSSDKKFPDLSFNELKAFVLAFNGYLNSNNIKSGDKVAVIIPNTPLAIFMLIAVIATGRVLVPLNPKLSSGEINYIIEDSKPNLIISLLPGNDYHLEKKGIKLIKEKGKPYYDLIMAHRNDQAEISISSADEAEIVYTSGSTGNPKGVVITQRNLISNAQGIYLRVRPEKTDTFLTITPLFHNSGQFFSTFVPLWGGASCVVVRPDIGLTHFWYYIKTHQINWTLGMPTHINHLLHNATSEQEPSTLKAIIVGGARLENKSHRLFQETFNVPILKTYGLTETCSFASCDEIDDENRTIGSSGTPISTNEVAVFNEMNEQLSPGVEGEIRMKGDNIFQHYLNKPDLTVSRFVDGWFCSGDLGHFDEFGNIYVRDRLDNMMIVSGENVYPADVENYVPLLEGMKFGVLSSVPDELAGRRLVLVYERSRDDFEDAETWVKTLFSYVAPYKIPKHFIKIEALGASEIPKASNGKILRKKLENLLLVKFDEVIVSEQA
jgi:long-chain acyl-CoA synthetase